MTLPGTLDWKPALDEPTLLADAVYAALQQWPRAVDVFAASIDADLADTAQFCAHYNVELVESANCVVVNRMVTVSGSPRICLVSVTM